MIDANSQSKLYLYRTFWSENDQEFVGLCTEFPSLSYLDSDPAKALIGIMEVVKYCIEDLLEQGEPIPAPLSLQNFSGRFQVRIPAEQHRQLVIEAAEQEISLNRLVSSRLMLQGAAKISSHATTVGSKLPVKGKVGKRVSKDQFMTRSKTQNKSKNKKWKKGVSAKSL